LLGIPETPVSHYPLLAISQFADVVYGLQVCPERRQGRNPVPYLRVANVQRGYLDLREMKYIDVTAKEAEQYRLQLGDVLLCEGNSADLVGRGAIWAGEVENCVHQNHVLRVRLNRELVIPEFLLAYVNSGAGQAYFRSKAKRTTNLASINSQEVKDMQVPVPPLDVQTSLVAEVQAAKAQAAVLRGQADYAASSAASEFEQSLTESSELDEGRPPVA
jgi:type I restriction enzyme S subunit